SAEVMYKICNEVPKLLSAVDSSIPKALDAIVAKALEKIPANRYASAQEFQQALRSGWQAFSPKPPSPTLSQTARVIATAIHRQLIPLVGPMARILVREAAATTASRQELYRLLASHLRTPQERRQFLMTSERAWSGAAGDAVISGLSAGRPVTPEATQRVGE